ncbi:MAG TPA: class I SAM-dependent methyltransferase [Deltaproteobacteria bacterium]|nr:class I SAM-dependent methyltransferase [Deltaproteobacteria bacterium]
MGHDGEVVDRVGRYRVIDCRGCGFVHIDPVPAERELAGVYEREYYEYEKPEFIERQREDLEWWNLVFDERLEVMEEVVGPGRRRLLDVGCGPGFFLRRAAGRGWRGVGIEPSKAAGAHARSMGVEVMEGFFNDLSGGLGERSFDAVHLSEVLEHVPDPAGLMEGVFGLLAPGGVVCVAAPNDYSPVQKVLRRRLGFGPYWLAPPHHINYFTFESLGALVRRAGFAELRPVATFPMDFFLLMGEDYVGDDALGRRCHAKRKRLEMMLAEPELKDFKRELYRLMADHSVGREAVVFGVKP